MQDGSDRGRLFTKRASIERRLGRFAAAGASLRCAALWDPSKRSVAEEKCRLLLDLGLPARAALLMAPWIESSPQDASLRLLRAQALLASGDFERAALDYETARTMSLPEFTIDAEIALADAWRGAGEPESATEVLDRAIRHHGLNPALVQAAIEIDLAAERFDAALARHDQLRRGGGATPRWLDRQGDLFAQSGRAAEARAAWEAAITAQAALPLRRRRTAAATRLLEQLHKKLDPLGGRETP